MEIRKKVKKNITGILQGDEIKGDCTMTASKEEIQ